MINEEGEEVLLDEVCCPQCKVSTQQDQLTDHVLAEQVCTSCEEEEERLAVARCEDCQEFHCLDCTRAHQRVRLTRTHRVVSLPDSTVCLSHPESQRLICRTCRVFVCSQCPPPAGCSQDHDWRPHQTVAAGVRELLSQDLHELQQKEVELEASLAALQISISEVGSSEKSLQLQLDKIREKLISVIQDRHQHLLQEVTQFHTKRRNLLEARKSHLEKTRAQIDQFKQFVTSILQPSVSTDQNLLRAEEVIMNQTNKLKHSKVSLRPEETEFMHLSFQQSKFRGEEVFTNLSEVVGLVMNDVQVNLSRSSEVRESPEEEGERSSVRPDHSLQQQTERQPAPGPAEHLVGGDARSRTEGSQESAGPSGAERRSSRIRRSTTRSWLEDSAQSDNENNEVPRVRKTTKYQEEEEASQESNFDLKEAVEAEAEEEDIDTIESVLDHRLGKVGATGNSTKYWAVKDNGDPNERVETTETEQQYFIKWAGLSHINNTWESQSSLDAKKKGSLEVKGIRRLNNYQQKLAEEEGKRRKADPEDVEYQEIEIEMGRQMLVTYTEIERIFSQRKNENNTNDYFVKWRNLAYVDATWEDESVIKTYYSEALTEYNARKKAKCNPRSYKESMKFFKKTFKPLKEQPSFIGSESLRLRDYQMDGLNFMLKAWHNGDSLILADEMVGLIVGIFMTVLNKYLLQGLGKTIQSISFLKYLFHVYPFKGPMLVVVPLSTMAAWQKEFSTWAPDLNTICYTGPAKSRKIIRQYELQNSSGELTFNVLLTNYEIVRQEREFFQEVEWSNIVIDEAHR